ncbi:hypothetical protein GCM10010193_26810 [Kitasatospora atroaurantiaca]|uniref:Uncharacterized protein n=1 Tax=Kitasatospora atroaurantiaca TaxID=285545 RepID=A0A561EK60_9ACTN|nr:hypothetical protein [Kitasatospora atroaurantiaca]TWE15996.1 hypothetical protein FB465_0952 [Kitasatospora atroaurantiaca]
MTLQTPQPPPSALRAVLGALDCEAALCQPAAAALRGAAGALLPTHPLAVHVLDGPGTHLASARRTGWRFLIKHSPLKQGASEVAAAAEVVETPDGHSFSHFTAGPYLDSTVRALRQAWQLAQASRSRHQPRLLSMPGHYATALWLHHPEPGPATDLLIPLAPAPLGITAHRVYPAAELLALLERTRVPAPLALGIS